MDIHPLNLLLHKIQELTGVDTQVQLVSTPCVTIPVYSSIKFSLEEEPLASIKTETFHLIATGENICIPVVRLAEESFTLPENLTVSKLLLQEFTKHYPTYLKKLIVHTNIYSNKITLLTTTPEIIRHNTSLSIFCRFYARILVPTSLGDHILQNCKRSKCPSVLKCTLGTTNTDCVLSYLL